jgi:hypothetical protein
MTSFLFTYGRKSLVPGGTVVSPPEKRGAATPASVGFNFFFIVACGAGLTPDKKIKKRLSVEFVNGLLRGETNQFQAGPAAFGGNRGKGANRRWNSLGGDQPLR